MPLRFVLLGTLRGLIIQPTRDIFSAMPLTTNLNFLRSESSMSKALMTPYVCFANAFIAIALQSYQKSIRIKTLFVIGFEKTEILVQLCHYNDRKHQPICQIHSA